MEKTVTCCTDGRLYSYFCGYLLWVGLDRGKCICTSLGK